MKTSSHTFEHNTLHVEFDTLFERLRFVIIDSSNSVIDGNGSLECTSRNDTFFSKPTSTLRINVSGKAVILVVEEKDGIQCQRAFFFARPHSTPQPTPHPTFESAAAMLGSVFQKPKNESISCKNESISLKNENISLSFTRKGSR